MHKYAPVTRFTNIDYILDWYVLFPNTADDGLVVVNASRGEVETPSFHCYDATDDAEGNDYQREDDQKMKSMTLPVCDGTK